MTAYESSIRAWAMNRGMGDYLTARLDDVEEFMRKDGYMEKFYEAFPDYDPAETAIADVLAQIKPLAVEYYRLTGKPLGITGEIGEFEVARLLNLELERARSTGYDATDQSQRRYQIKTRSLSLDDAGRWKSNMTGKLNNKEWDAALLAVMNREFEMLEIWEADRSDVDHELNRPGSKGRNERRMLPLSKFMEIGRLRFHRDYENRQYLDDRHWSRSET